jgi:hypothetical protein
MRYRVTSSLLGMAIVVSVALFFSAFPSIIVAQSCTGTAGQNTVYGNCTTGTPGTLGSSAFIDAATFSSSGDICARIHAILTTSYPANGEVIDARGVLPASGTSQNCSTNPWATVTAPSTVLLPAGTIQISTQWSLPTGTRIIGQGAGSPGAGITTIQAAPGFTTNLALIRMIGSARTSVEDLALDGNGVTGVGGITNSTSQELTYVKRVAMTNILGIGLSVTSGAAQSGPYSDINFSTTSTAATTACVSLQTSTRGVHGLTCNGASIAGSTGVKIDGPNNTIEDAQISGFSDAIAIGRSLTAPSNVLFNIRGGSGVTNLVHIGSSSTNVTIMSGSTNGATNAIQDDVTDALLTASSNPTIAIYALGAAVSPGFSRFTTSPSVPSWVVGTSVPPTSGVTCPQGSLYSNTAGTASHTWYVCESNQWIDID